MNRKPVPMLGSALLILALLAAPVGAMRPNATAPAPSAAADCCGGCCGGCCGETSGATPGADCCSDGLPGCPLPCCCGLTCMAVRPAAPQDPGAAAPAGIVIAADGVPFVFPRPIDRPPRA